MGKLMVVVTRFLLLCAVLLALPAVAVADESAPTLSPVQGPVGTHVTASASDWTGCTSMSVSGWGQTLDTKPINNGAFSLSFNVPVGAPLGAQQLQFSPGCSHSAWMPFVTFTVTSVPETDFKQTDPQWSTSPDKPDNINTHLNHSADCGDMWRFGCAVTAAADVFNNYGVHYLPDETTLLDPGTLNNWMTLNGAFDSRCGTNWPIVAHAAGIGPNSFMGDTDPGWSTRVASIDAALQNGNLPILGIHTDSIQLHFVVLAKKSSDNPPDYTIIDPALYPTFTPNTPGNTGNSLSASYGDFNTISKYVIIYDKHTLPQKSLTVVAYSPVQMLFTDPSGKQTGYQTATNTYVEDIPGTAYAPMYGLSDDSGQFPPMPDTLYYQQNNPTDGTYTLQVYGTGNGPYRIDFTSMTATGSVVQNTITGTATTGKIDTYLVTTSSNANTPIVISTPEPTPAESSGGGGGGGGCALSTNADFDPTLFILLGLSIWSLVRRHYRNQRVVA